MGHFIEGVVTEICTPFTRDGQIDWEYLHDMIKWQLSCGVQAFFVNGYAGECHELTLDEKLAVVAAVHEVAHPHGAKIMSCTFENSVQLNKTLIAAYEEQGFSDCYCITAPPLLQVLAGCTPRLVGRAHRLWSAPRLHLQLCGAGGPL